MNLAGIVRGPISGVNPQIIAMWQPAAGGYDTLPDGTQVPIYKGAIQLCLQVQALSSTELQKLDGMNIQGIRRAVYIESQVAGVIRADQKGGDLLTFPEMPDGPQRTWLCATVLETWPDWVKVAVVLQRDKHV